MERKRWMKILSGCSMVSLILAGCGGGGGGGGSSRSNAAPIATPAQAQKAAATFLLVMDDGFSNLLSSSAGASSSSRKFAARIASENLPKMDSYFALQQFLANAAKATPAQKAAVSDCSGGGTITEDYVEKPDAGGFKRTTAYANCREGILLMNGTLSSEASYGATSQFIYIEGNGDQDVDDAVDLVIQEVDTAGNVVSTWKASSTDTSTETVVTDTPTAFDSNESSSFTGKHTYSDATDTFSLTASMSDTGTNKNILSGGFVTNTEEEKITNGTMVLSETISGGNIGLTFTANNLKSKDIYSSTATEETGSWEGSGSYVTVMIPDTCLDGAYTIKTLLPVQYVDNYETGQRKTSAGEIELNSAARIVISNNDIDDIFTIYLGTDPSPVFTGTEEELSATTMEACPIFGLASVP